MSRLTSLPSNLSQAMRDPVGMNGFDGRRYFRRPEPSFTLQGLPAFWIETQSFQESPAPFIYDDNASPFDFAIVKGWLKFLRRLFKAENDIVE